VGISLAFTALNILAIVIDWVVFSPMVEFLALFYGVFIGYYSVWDIYDDLVTRTAEGSDAVACHQLVPCCFPRCVGVQFWIVAFLFQVVGLYIALVWQVSNQQF
jgi:Peptidase M50B-like